MTPSPSSPFTALFVRGAEPADLRFAVDLAGSALATGEGVIIALFEAAVGAFADAARDPRLGPDLVALRALAQLGGHRFEVVACSRAVETAGLDPDAVEAETGIDAVLGMPAIWRRVRDARVIVIG